MGLSISKDKPFDYTFNFMGMECKVKAEHDDECVLVSLHTPFYSRVEKFEAAAAIAELQRLLDWMKE